APEPEAPDEIVGIAQVIGHERGPAALDDGSRPLAKIPFETSAGKEAGVLAVAGNEQQRTRLAVRRACRVNENAERHRVTGSPLALEQGQEGTESRFHPVGLCPG